MPNPPYTHNNNDSSAGTKEVTETGDQGESFRRFLGIGRVQAKGQEGNRQAGENHHIK